jgi:hypothetical protein
MDIVDITKEAEPFGVHNYRKYFAVYNSMYNDSGKYKDILSLGFKRIVYEDDGVGLIKFSEYIPIWWFNLCGVLEPYLWSKVVVQNNTTSHVGAIQDFDDAILIPMCRLLFKSPRLPSPWVGSYASNRVVDRVVKGPNLNTTVVPHWRHTIEMTTFLGEDLEDKVQALVSLFKLFDIRAPANQTMASIDAICKGK